MLYCSLGRLPDGIHIRLHLSSWAMLWKLILICFVLYHHLYISFIMYLILSVESLLQCRLVKQLCLLSIWPMLILFQISIFWTSSFLCIAACHLLSRKVFTMYSFYLWYISSFSNSSVPFLNFMDFLISLYFKLLDSLIFIHICLFM